MNEHLEEIIKINNFSDRRVESINSVKEFVDRISTTKYLELETVGELKNQFGVLPNIVTWGDYFQTEMAASLMHVTDEEYEKAIDTLKFDMISSYTIFKDKGKRFFEWINIECDEIAKDENCNYTEEDGEMFHLKILMDYFVNLGLDDNFSRDEMRWYEKFEEARAI